MSDRLSEPLLLQEPGPQLPENELGLGHVLLHPAPGHPELGGQVQLELELGVLPVLGEQDFGV